MDAEGLSARLVKSELAEAKLLRPKCASTGDLHKLSVLNNVHRNHHVLLTQKIPQDQSQQVSIHRS